MRVNAAVAALAAAGDGDGDDSADDVEGCTGGEGGSDVRSSLAGDTAAVCDFTGTAGVTLAVDDASSSVALTWVGDSKSVERSDSGERK